MQSFLLPTATIFALGCATASASPSTWPDLSQPPVATPADRTSDVGLVITIEDYDRLPDVPGAVENGNAWAAWLRARGMAAVRQLGDGDATREGMLDAARAIRERRRSGGGVWVVFVGHGSPGDGAGALVGVDARPTASSLQSRSVSPDELLAALGSDDGVPVFALWDACFSGISPEGALTREALQPVRPVAVSTRDSTTVLVAARGDQYAGSIPGLGRPAFSWLVLGALRGWGDKNRDGRVSASEAVEWSSDRLAELAVQRVQQPEGAGAVERVLSSGRERAPDLAALVAMGEALAPVAAPPSAVVATPAGVGKAGVDWMSPSVGKLKWVPPGSFTMGSPPTETFHDETETQHAVTLTSGFLLMDSEVTQGQWRAAMGANPAVVGRDAGGVECEVGGVGDALPVVCISWYDALAFANALSSAEALEPAYVVRGESVSFRRGATGYRLPTEAEWEFAARGGGQAHVFAGSDRACEVGNVPNGTKARGRAYQRMGYAMDGWVASTCDDGFSGLAPPRSFRANELGLYDMSGNAAEWVWDAWGLYPESAVDPAGPPSAANGSLFRGGMWGMHIKFSRVASRDGVSTRSERWSSVGLRLARTVR